MRRPGEVLSRFQLLEHAWDYEYENRSNIVDSYVRLLRRKIDKPFGVRVDPDRARRRIPAPRDQGVVTRLSIRLRITLAFAGVMAILLAGLGLFIYLRFQDQLNEAINNGLISRAKDVGTLVGRSGGDLKGGGNLPGEDTFAQVLTPSGQVFGATTAPLSHAPLLSPQELREATTTPIRVDRADVEALEGPARLFARPQATAGRRLVVLTGASLDDRNEALRQSADDPADRRARRSAARVAGGVRGGLWSSSAGGGDASPGGGDLGRRARPAPASSQDR